MNCLKKLRIFSISFLFLVMWSFRNYWTTLWFCLYQSFMPILLFKDDLYVCDSFHSGDSILKTNNSKTCENYFKERKMTLNQSNIQNRTQNTYYSNKHSNYRWLCFLRVHVCTWENSYCSTNDSFWFTDHKYWRELQSPYRRVYLPCVWYLRFLMDLILRRRRLFFLWDYC